MVIGPVIHYLNSLDALNTSNERVRDFVLGKYRDNFQPSGVFIWIDVRDLAEAHVRAIEVEAAGGNRFLTTAGYFSNKRIAEAIREAYPDLDDKLPPKDVKDDFPTDVYGIDNSKSIKVLGIKYRSLNESVKDTVASIKEVGGI